MFPLTKYRSPLNRQNEHSLALKVHTAMESMKTYTIFCVIMSNRLSNFLLMKWKKYLALNYLEVQQFIQHGGMDTTIVTHGKKPDMRCVIFKMAF